MTCTLRKFVNFFPYSLEYIENNVNKMRAIEENSETSNSSNKVKFKEDKNRIFQNSAEKIANSSSVSLDNSVDYQPHHNIIELFSNALNKLDIKRNENNVQVFIDF